MTLPSPPPVPSPAPPALPSGQTSDSDKLSLLAIFHFVLGGLALAGLAFLFLHFEFMNFIFLNAKVLQHQPQPAPISPEAIIGVMKIFYLFFAVVLFLGGAANALSGYFLLTKRHRMFSLVVAGIDCVQIPFGTVLGVFTIVLLIRPSVMHLYGEPAGSATS